MSDMVTDVITEDEDVDIPSSSLANIIIEIHCSTTKELDVKAGT